METSEFGYMELKSIVGRGIAFVNRYLSCVVRGVTSLIGERKAKSDQVYTILTANIRNPSVSRR